jgi:hypothetical protein
MSLQDTLWLLLGSLLGFGMSLAVSAVSSRLRRKQARAEAAAWDSKRVDRQRL